MANLEKLNNLSSGKSKWLEEAKARQENKVKLNHARSIAIKILATLREKSMKQIELAVMLNVSPQQINKIVKGKGNLTLETISKLEVALGIQLMLDYEITYNDVKVEITRKCSYMKKEIATIKSIYKHSEDIFDDSSLIEECEMYA